MSEQRHNDQAQFFPSKRGKIINTVPQHQMASIQSQPPDVSTPSQNLSVYEVVTLSILLFGFFTKDLQLLGVACVMAAALKGSSVLKPLLSLLKRQRFLPESHEE